MTKQKQPDAPAFARRRGEPSQEFAWHDERGGYHEGQTDAAGLFVPEDESGVEYAISRGWPVADAVSETEPSQPAEAGKEND